MISTASWLSLSVYLWCITHLNAIFIRCQLPQFHIWVTKCLRRTTITTHPPPAFHEANVNQSQPPLKKGSKDKDVLQGLPAPERGAEASGQGQVHLRGSRAGEKSPLTSSLRSFFYFTNPRRLSVEMMLQTLGFSSCPPKPASCQVHVGIGVGVGTSIKCHWEIPRRPLWVSFFFKKG